MCGRRPRCKRNLTCGLRSGASHVSGLLSRLHDRWPWCDPRIGSRSKFRAVAPIDPSRVFPIDGSTVRITPSVGASIAIRWIDRWTTTGSVEAKPGTGHTRSPLEKHRQWLLDLVAAEPDLTLDEIGARLGSNKKLKTATSSVWRFYERHGISFKKNTARRRAGST